MRGIKSEHWSSSLDIKGHRHYENRTEILYTEIHTHNRNKNRLENSHQKTYAYTEIRNTWKIHEWNTQLT